MQNPASPLRKACDQPETPTAHYDFPSPKNANDCKFVVLIRHLRSDLPASQKMGLHSGRESRLLFVSLH